MNEEELIEQLADKEHASWARWMTYLFSKCNRDEMNGALVIPESLVWRWQRQIDTPYDQLSEREKQSDRDEVAHILPIIRQAIVQDGVLSGADMLWLRKMVRFEAREVIREELAQAMERFFARGLRRLESAIKAEPHDEMDEIAAILATLAPEQLEEVMVKVRQKLA